MIPALRYGPVERWRASRRIVGVGASHDHRSPSQGAPDCRGGAVFGTDVRGQSRATRELTSGGPGRYRTQAQRWINSARAFASSGRGTQPRPPDRGGSSDHQCPRQPRRLRALRSCAATSSTSVGKMLRPAMEMTSRPHTAGHSLKGAVAVAAISGSIGCPLGNRHHRRTANSISANFTLARPPAA